MNVRVVSGYLLQKCPTLSCSEKEEEEEVACHDGNGSDTWRDEGVVYI